MFTLGSLNHRLCEDPVGLGAAGRETCATCICPQPLSHWRAGGRKETASHIAAVLCGSGAPSRTTRGTETAGPEHRRLRWRRGQKGSVSVLMRIRSTEHRERPGLWAPVSSGSSEVRASDEGGGGCSKGTRGCPSIAGWFLGTGKVQVALGAAGDVEKEMQKPRHSEV